MNNLKYNAVAFLTTIAAFAILVSLANVASGIAAFSLALVLNAACLGAIIATVTVALTTCVFRRSVSDTFCFSASGALAALGIYLVLCLTSGEGLELFAAVLVAVFGLLPSLLGSAAAVCYKRFSAR